MERLTSTHLDVRIEPDQGGRLAQITADRIDLLVEPGGPASGTLAWGSYPMVPWAGRVRDGQFGFRGRRYELPRTMGAHAIHGVGFISAWEVSRVDERSIELGLALPSDARWPFGGVARQIISVDEASLRLELEVTATESAFPASVGWHPWFRQPTRLQFDPTAMFRRDRHHITVDELVEVPPGPWDDCFVNDRPVVAEIDGRTLRLTSDCTTWVVYDEPPHATCIEPQTGPPDALNIRQHVVEPGDSLSAWYRIELLD